MKRFLKITLVVLLPLILSAAVGCDDGPRQVQETSEYSFDDMAAQAAADSELSEVEE